jgi:hypothetical protein
MYVYIEFATFESGTCIEDGYESLPVERVFTEPFRVEQDVHNAFEAMRERMMKVNPDVEVGLVTYTIDATHEELMKMARKTVSNGLWNYGVPGRHLQRL